MPGAFRIFDFSAGRLLLGDLKVQRFAAGRADRLAVQQGFLVHHGGSTAGRAGHFVPRGAVVGLLGGFIIVLIGQLMDFFL